MELKTRLTSRQKSIVRGMRHLIFDKIRELDDLEVDGNLFNNHSKIHDALDYLMTGASSFIDYFSEDKENYWKICEVYDSIWNRKLGEYKKLTQ